MGLRSLSGGAVALSLVRSCPADPTAVGFDTVGDGGDGSDKCGSSPRTGCQGTVLPRRTACLCPLGSVAFEVVAGLGITRATGLWRFRRSSGSFGGEKVRQPAVAP
jgi:hypothetical protein